MTDKYKNYLQNCNGYKKLITQMSAWSMPTVAWGICVRAKIINVKIAIVCHWDLVNISHVPHVFRVDTTDDMEQYSERAICHCCRQIDSLDLLHSGKREFNLTNEL